MINSQFALKLSDVEKYKEMKNSPMYREYVHGIVHSPVYNVITKQHVEYIDVTEDITKLQNDVKLTPKELNKIFKSAISKMAVSIVADTLIMKEIIDVGIDNAKDDLDGNFMTTYLLGLSEKKYYKKAEQILEKDPDITSVLYKGYQEWIKRNQGKTEVINLDDSDIKPKNPQKTPRKRDKSIKFNIEADQIRI